MEMSTLPAMAPSSAVVSHSALPVSRLIASAICGARALSTAERAANGVTGDSPASFCSAAR